MSNNEWVEQFKSKNKDYKDYCILGKYINSRTLIKIKHIPCGKIYKALPRELMRGKSRCKECTQKLNSQNQYDKHRPKIIKKASEVLGSSYEVLDCNWDKSGRPFLTIHHLKCDRVYKERVDHVLTEHRTCSCTKEIKSYGELRIKKYLNLKNIRYESPKIYKELKDIQPLHYDFYLPDYNILIEYQGEQHYNPKHQISAKQDGFKRQQYHDKLKRNYAKKLNIVLYEIPYKIKTQKDINNYLKKLLAITRK